MQKKQEAEKLSKKKTGKLYICNFKSEIHEANSTIHYYFTFYVS